MNVVFLAYRPWAMEVIKKISETLDDKWNYSTIKTPEKLNEYILEIKDENLVIIAIGWSSIIEPEITDRYLCLGVHPSDLPKYRGGSPIQNQIIQGVTDTKCTLFRLTKNLDAGEIWGKSALSLEGDCMDVIFEHIVDATYDLLRSFFSKFPNIETQDQKLFDGSYFKRRKPEQSRLVSEDFDFRDITRLYNVMRCLTAPYPNAYIEDEIGNRLYFEKVTFVKNH